MGLRLGHLWPFEVQKRTLGKPQGRCVRHAQVNARKSVEPGFHVGTHATAKHETLARVRLRPGSGLDLILYHFKGTPSQLQARKGLGNPR